MFLGSVYLRKGSVYIPTTGIVTPGYQREEEPIAVVPVSDTAALRRALLEAIARGNPKAPNWQRHEMPPPAHLKYAGVKTWSEFMRRNKRWDFVEHDGIWEIVGLKAAPHGRLVPDDDQKKSLPAGTTPEAAADRMVEVLQAAAQD